MEDYYRDGYNHGRGRDYLNSGHELPHNLGDIYSYEEGRKYGEYRKKLSEEIDRELEGYWH